MGSHGSKYANHDINHNENSTHVEHNTRKVYAKTSGFRLFDIHEEGSGGANAVHGLTGIGLVGEVLVGVIILIILVKVYQRWLACRIRNTAYKAYYRHQTASDPYALPAPVTASGRNGSGTTYYGPHMRSVEVLGRLTEEVRELKKAKKTFEHSLARTQAQVHANATAEEGAENKVVATTSPRHARNVYAETEREENG